MKSNKISSLHYAKEDIPTKTIKFRFHDYKNEQDMERLKKEDYIHGGIQKDFYKDDEKEYCNCPLCDDDNYIQLDEDKGLAIVKCKSCDLIYTNPRAINAEKNYYGEESVFYNEARLIFLNKKTHHRDPNYAFELKKIKRFKPRGKLLDIGTNMGFFLRKAQEAGYETEGVEPSPSLSKIAREQWNLKVYNSFLEDTNLPNSTYDIITMIDVFEHITDPKGILDKCYTLLKDDGLLAIKVPNGDYNYTKMKLSKILGKKSNMDIWDLNEHVIHYTPKTFSKMMHLKGFNIKKMIIPLPIHPPIWANLVGHYYQYPSPFILDWKRIVLRKLFYFAGKFESLFSKKNHFAPDLMFLLIKDSNTRKT